MAKRIIYCADGTWNNEGTNTNVYKFFKAMNFTAEQCPIYDDGVGSDGGVLSRFLGGAFGEGLDQKIKDGYTRISHLYEHGDRVFLFGFSRGAYVARSLGGMIANCGLPTQNVDDQQTAMAFDAYRQRDPAQRPQQFAALKQRYAPDMAVIAMIGVWDTVGSLGLPAIFGGIDMTRYAFLDTTLHPDVKYACHAVSIDERRREFPSTLWSNANSPAPGQVIEQVYFAGVHCDVGGGYPETGLSDITLAWMMKKAAAQGVDFDQNVYKTYANLDPKHALDMKHESWSLKWTPAKLRDIDDKACISNSVYMRLQHDAAYTPDNLKHNAGVLATGYTVSEVVCLAPPTSSAASGSTP